MQPATIRARTSVARCSAASPAPRACAVSPAVPMRKKPKLQKMKSKMTAAAAIAPRRCAWPSLPIIGASAMPSNGVDKWASVIGSASRTTRAWLTRGGFTLVFFGLADTAQPPGSAGVAQIHEPQHQPDRNDDRGSREDIIGDLADRIEPEVPNSINELFQSTKDVPGPDVEPHQESADDQGDKKKAQEDAAGRAAQKTVERRLLRTRADTGRGGRLFRCRPVGRRVRRKTFIFAHAVPLKSKLRRRERPGPNNLADSLPVVSTSHFKRDGGGLAGANAKRRRAAFQAVFLQRRIRRA